MNNSPVKLTLDIAIYSTFKHTLAGDNRYAIDTLSDNTSTWVEDIRNSDVGYMKFNKGQVLKIKRARFIPDVPGLEVGGDSGNYAGMLNMLQGVAGSGGAFTPTAGTIPTLLRFMKFNEWEDKDFTMKFETDQAEIGIGMGSTISVTDFNVQEDWVGQDVTFRVEAEAELYIGD